MVVRDGANELVLQDYARWAEPLQQGLTRVLKAQLLADHSVGRVDTAPLPFEADRDYDVGIDIVLCEGATEGARHVARFEAVIEISTVGPQAHVVARRDFVAPEAGWNGTDYGRLAGELSAGRGRAGPGNPLGAAAEVTRPPLPQGGGDPLQRGRHVLAAVEGADAHVPLAAAAEAGPRRAHDLGPVEQQVEELPGVAPGVDPDVRRVVAADAGEAEALAPPRGSAGRCRGRSRSGRASAPGRRPCRRPPRPAGSDRRRR